MRDGDLAENEHPSAIVDVAALQRDLADALQRVADAEAQVKVLERALAKRGRLLSEVRQKLKAAGAQ